LVRAGIAAQLSLLGIAELGAVPRLAAIARGHPHGFDTLAIAESQQVADCPIGGDKLLLNLRHPHPIAGIGKLAPQGNWQSAELFEFRPPLPVQTVPNLAGPVRSLSIAS
jgi:hypothetical protein